MKEKLAVQCKKKHGTVSTVLKGNYKKPCAITYISPHTYVLGRKKNKYNDFDVLAADAGLSLLALKMVGTKRIKRGAFDLSSDGYESLNYMNQNNMSVYFIGGKQDEIEVAVERLQSKFPNLNIIGYSNGFLDESDKSELIKKLSTEEPDLVVLSMGYPRQDDFALQIKKSNIKSIITTSGGFITQTSMIGNYYPDWTIKYRLRWFYRIWKEPHIFHTRLIYYPFFLILFFWDYITSKKHNGES